MLTRSSQERQDRQKIWGSNASPYTGGTDVCVRHIPIQSRESHHRYNAQYGHDGHACMYGQNQRPTA